MAGSLNSVQLAGNLCTSPDLTYTGGQKETSKAVCHFRLAVKRLFSKSDESDFISCVAFGKNAEFVSEYFMKGDAAIVVGRIQTGSFINKEGVKVYTFEIVIDTIDFNESKSSRDARRGQGQQSQPQQVQGQPQQMPQQMPQQVQGQMMQGQPQQVQMMPQGQQMPQQVQGQMMPQGQQMPQQMGQMPQQAPQQMGQMPQQAPQQAPQQGYPQQMPQQGMMAGAGVPSGFGTMPANMEFH